MIIAQEGGAVLRQAREDDLPGVAGIAACCYAPINGSYVELLGEDCYAAAYGSSTKTWQERKTSRLLRLYREHPDWL